MKLKSLKITDYRKYQFFYVYFKSLLGLFLERNSNKRVLRSAPPEFKETNANLLQFVNQSLDDMMRYVLIS